MPVDQPRHHKVFFLDSHPIPARAIAAGLYIVATPIGHLGDITLRALETLAAADIVACEDTRVTRKLLERYGIKTSLTSYHEHNAESARPKLLARLGAGAAIALVCDAGTPLISDPGYKLVRAAQIEGYPVTAIPGASAMLAALTVAGLPTDRFLFTGFLPVKQTARRARIAELAGVSATLVFYESGPRLAAALADLAAAMGAREAAICRELTKLHEEVRRAPLTALAEHYAQGGETRGEFVIVIAPPDETAASPAAEDVDMLLRRALATASLKDAVAQVAEITGRPRRDIYQRALAMAEANREPNQTPSIG